MRRQAIPNAWSGGLAGAAATLLMSALMITSKRTDVMTRDYPPRKITRAFLRTLTSKPNPTALNAATTASHLSYGIAGGMLYAGIRELLPSRVPPAAAGTVYGLMVWAVSYLGWVPAMRLMPPPGKDQPGRVATMISAHVLYGSALGLIEARLRGK